MTLQFLAAVDLWGLRVTGTQRQVELETIFLRLFLYVIAYVKLDVRWFESLATTALSETKTHDSGMSVLIPRISPSVFLVAILAEFDHHVDTGGVASLPWTGLGFRAHYKKVRGWKCGRQADDSSLLTSNMKVRRLHPQREL